MNICGIYTRDHLVTRIDDSWEVRWFRSTNLIYLRSKFEDCGGMLHAFEKQEQYLSIHLIIIDQHAFIYADRQTDQFINGKSNGHIRVDKK